MRKPHFSLFNRLLLIVLFSLVISCEQRDKAFQLNGSTMGTQFNITLVDTSPPSTKINNLIQNRLESINQQLSTWDQNSEISQFNQMNSMQWFKVSDDFNQVVIQAIKIAHMTQGAFDFSVSPIVKLWGFGSAHPNEKIPNQQSIENLKSHIGYQYLMHNDNSIKKLNPKLQVDFSAIAKGYAVDEIHKLLLSQGFKNFLVEIGGEIRTHGKNNENKAWAIGIRSPDTNQFEALKTLQLNNKALATSGDYEQFFINKNKRYSHIINPKTYYPTSNNIASVTVVANDCATADALATAFMVIGVAESIKLSHELDVKAYFILRDKSKLQFIES